MGKQKTTVEPVNGKKEDEKIIVPPIMADNNSSAVDMVKELRQDMSRSNRGMELSKYQVQEGMQSKDKVSFFTHYLNFDDVLRMNTIESFVDISPLIIRKTSTKNMDRIKIMLTNVYIKHVDNHKTNMTSLERKREDAYVKILSSDSSDSGTVPTGIKKFFGIGKGK